MAKRPSEMTPATGGEIITDAIYEITVTKPFEYLRVQFVPAVDRVYRVKGNILVAIKDKVSDYRRVG